MTKRGRGVIGICVLALLGACSDGAPHGGSDGGGSDGGGSDGGGSGTVTPNILNEASFETDWSGFTDWAGSPPPTGPTLSRATDYAHSGTYSARRTWTPNPGGDEGSQFLYQFGATDRVWVRFYVRLTASISTIMKFARFYDTDFATPLGGFFLGAGDQIFSFGTDAENSSITTYFGLAQSGVIDGNWHALEVEYWRNGDPSGYPSAAFWFDGLPMSMPDGPNVQYAGSGNASYWAGGRLYSGQRTNTVQVGYIEWLATLNSGNTTTGQVNIDDISISTDGRIGP